MMHEQSIEKKNQRKAPPDVVPEPGLAIETRSKSRTWGFERDKIQNMYQGKGDTNAYGANLETGQ